MPYFNHAYQPQIHNSNLFDVAGNLTMNQVSNNELIMQQGIHALERNSAIDAIHNSRERFPPPKCHPETRQTILAHIIAWFEESVQSSSGNKSILWLYGPAGAGKSAIAQTIAEIFSEHMLKIAASFFFTRGKDRRGTVTYFVATIAYQMTTSIPEMRDDIGKVVAYNPEILRLSLEVQIQRLIVEPFHSFIFRTQPHTLSQLRYLVIIDGLDECDGDENQKAIILYIADIIHKHNLPFSFLIASRPEPQIMDTFRNDLRLADLTTEFQLDPSHSDIRTFLLSGFHKIRNSHPSLASLEGPWPSQDEINTLVYQSSGYFIYASTVIKFVDDKDMRPVESLDLVLSAASRPFSGLDTLYTQILSTVPQHNRSHLMSILEMKIALTGFYGLAMGGFELLLQLPTGGIHIILRRLHSLLEVTVFGIDYHHASFADYLRSKERSGIFHADSCLGHAKLAKAIVKLLKMGIDIPRCLTFFGSLDLHICCASYLLNDDTQFQEDLQAVSIGSWKALSMCDNEFELLLRTLDQWIDSFEHLRHPPANIIQLFIGIRRATRLRAIESGKFTPLPIFTVTESMNIHLTFGRLFVEANLDISQDCMPYVFEECHPYLESYLEQSGSRKHLCDPILGHTLVVVLYLKGIIHNNVLGDLDYAKEWWTLHLAQSCPHPPYSNEIFYLLDSPGWLRASCDIDGSNSVIRWLKKIPDVPYNLISRWEDYRQGQIIQASLPSGSGLNPEWRFS